MKYRIYPTAQKRMLDIWHYTFAHWDSNQADDYLRGLEMAINQAAKRMLPWQSAPMPWSKKPTFMVKYKRHCIFFIELSDQEIGVISILHDAMDLPRRLLNEFREVDL